MEEDEVKTTAPMMMLFSTMSAMIASPASFGKSPSITEKEFLSPDQVPSAGSRRPRANSGGSDWEGADEFLANDRLAVQLQRHLRHVLPDLRMFITSEIDNRIQSQPEEQTLSVLLSMAPRVVVLAHTLVFFGVELALESAFIEAAASKIGNFTTQQERNQSEADLYVLLKSLIEDISWKDKQRDRTADSEYAESLLEVSLKSEGRAGQKDVAELIGGWFELINSTTQVVSACLHSLSNQPEFVGQLLNDLIGPKYTQFLEKGEGLVILDGLLEELGDASGHYGQALAKLIIAEMVLRF